MSNDTFDAYASELAALKVDKARRLTPKTEKERPHPKGETEAAFRRGRTMCWGHRDYARHESRNPQHRNTFPTTALN